jgi:hypothetical protein
MPLRIKHVRLFLPEGPQTYGADAIAAIELSAMGGHVAVRVGKEIRRYFNVPLEIVDEETLIETAPPPRMNRQ